MSFAIITDSTSDISPARAQELGIYVIPLHVIIEGEDLLDQVQITAEEYVARYADWSWSIDDAEGNVVDLLNKLEQGDDLKAYDRKPIILSCGPLPMMKAVADWAAERGIPAQLSMEQRMGCGVGACLTCTCKVAGHNTRVCKDGPVFRSTEVYL